MTGGLDRDVERGGDPRKNSRHHETVGANRESTDREGEKTTIHVVSPTDCAYLSEHSGAWTLGRDPFSTLKAQVTGVAPVKAL
ncbi:hypothetical protein Vau01_093510 [Virgisporangium aurantiacum]|uniref:Uncharacterized protein n=1 Tax=Virgisporangium aurantiacum TaxID=175570 RepID=A0A8J3ZHU9_9ACTN|nr:hypothetical protein Vau01_093510 [Virgisporangium aurantiacum]